MTQRCLWLARELPFPQNNGGRIYSAQVARSLAHAGVRVTYVGHAAEPGVAHAEGPVRWHAVPGGRRGTLSALTSTEPLQGAMNATPAYRRAVDELLEQAWDLVVLDEYGSGWLLDRVLAHRRRAVQRPVLVHLAHNHEASLWRGIASGFSGPPWKRLALWQNALKVARCERRLADAADVLGCITVEDAEAFADQGVRTPTLVLTPGYGGRVTRERTIDAATPRHVALVGSFHWVAKQDNLRALVRSAETAWSRHGITLEIVGDLPAPLRESLQGLPWVKAHGFVDDIAPLFARARMALVPEVIGGGFKLKMLDYVFHRVPVVTLDAAAAGLPESVRGAMLRCADLPSLVRTVVTRIDDVALLQRSQQQAFDAARRAFDWADRGRMLLAAVHRVQAGRGLEGLAIAAADQPQSST